MKNRSMKIISCMLAIALILGAVGAVRAEESEINSRLVGLFITKEDLAHYVGEDGVLWAVLSQETPDADVECVFEGIGGLRLFCFSLPEENGQDARVVSIADDGIADVHFDMIETGEAMKIDGIISCVPGEKEEFFFYNPVLLTLDGRVCAVPGDFMAVSAEMMPFGASVGQKLRDERKHTENGETMTDVTEASLQILAVREPLKIMFVQFNQAHEVLKTEEYAPGAVPEQIVLLKDADYLLLETEERTADGGVYIRREVFGREDDCLNTLSCREDGICLHHYHELLWQQE